jgi:hypothetical protein
MRSARQWLESSGSDEGERSAGAVESPSSSSLPMASATVTPSTAVDDARLRRQQEAEERRRKAAELREKMQQTLGADAVAAIASKPSPPPAPAAPATEPIPSAESPVSIKRKKSIQRVPGTGPAAQPAAKPSLKDKIKSVFDSYTSEDTAANTPLVPPMPASGSLPPTAPVVRPLNVDAVSAALADDEAVIMVANRGTQTACEVECQTDPDPHSVSCPMCYSAYYGHAPVPSPLCGDQHAPAPIYQFGGVHGQAFQPLHPAMQGLSGLATARALAFGGFNGTVPYAAAAGPPRLVPAHVYQQQLEAIQRRVEVLIQKHNLPAMPLTTGVR